jgi:hypothetical protein
VTRRQVFSLKKASDFFEKIISRLVLECQNLREDGNLLANVCECRQDCSGWPTAATIARRRSRIPTKLDFTKWRYLPELDRGERSRGSGLKCAVESSGDPNRLQHT